MLAISSGAFSATLLLGEEREGCDVATEEECILCEKSESEGTAKSGEYISWVEDLARAGVDPPSHRRAHPTKPANTVDLVHNYSEHILDHIDIRA